MDAGGQMRVPGPGMKARLVPDDHMLGLGVALGDLLEEAPAQLHVRRRLFFPVATIKIPHLR